MRAGVRATDSCQPPGAATGLTGVIDVAGGAYYGAFALRFDGTVWAWGPGNYGQWGDGTPASAGVRNTPAVIPDFDLDPTQ
jgi:alpha-tubulin suppressor-like RCC1 family protein